MASTTSSTHQIPTSFWGTPSERKDRNEASAYARNLEPCVSCGKGIKPGSGWSVIATGGGDLLIAIEEYDADPNGWNSDPGFMGSWVIGPECGKGIPAAFKARYEGVPK